MGTLHSIFSSESIEILLAALRQLFLFAALLCPLELLVPVRANQRILRAGMITDLFHFLVNPLWVSLGMTLVVTALQSLRQAFVPDGLSRLVESQPLPLRIVELFLFSELGAYWIHRLAHQVSWLWKLHAVHHSSTEMDFLAAHRQHPLEIILHLAVQNAPVILLGFPSESLLLLVLCQKLYTAFLHANVRIGYGRLSLVLASPVFHHLHHDKQLEDPQGRGTNFAALLPLFDRIFGTYRKPTSVFPAQYGIDDTLPSGYLGQLLFPFRAR